MGLVVVQEAKKAYGLTVLPRPLHRPGRTKYTHGVYLINQTPSLSPTNSPPEGLRAYGHHFGTKLNVLGIKF